MSANYFKTQKISSLTLLENTILGLDKCGEAPGINDPGKVVYDRYNAIYRCPKDYKLQGVQERECILETMSWKPKGEDSLCVPDKEIQK